MQPPIHISGNPQLDWIIFVVGWFVALYWLRALRLAREGARRFLANLLRAALIFLTLAAILPNVFRTLQLAQAQLIAGMVGFGFLIRWQNEKRSRYISKTTKRVVVARHLKTTGEEYDPKKHHIDHRWPHARGGSNTADNLRVIEKKKNLKKGAKRPRLPEMW